MGIIFSAHTDTVTPCDQITPIIHGNRISSDGTSILGSDDKAAIAIFIEALYQLHENGTPHGPVELLFTCAEEIGLKGIKGFDMSLLQANYAFVFDSAGKVGKIVLKAPYHLNMKLIIKGKAAHAGIEPEKGINAITALADIITRIPSGRIDSHTTINIGLITGGRATNIVPEEASCLLEIRSLESSTIKKYEDRIRKTVKEISTKHKARNKILSKLEYSGYTVPESDHITQVARKAMVSIKVKPEFEISGGGSDTNVLNRSGIKALNLSCGMQKAHSTGEYIYINDLIKGTQLVLSIIDTLYNEKEASPEKNKKSALPTKALL